MSDLTRCTGTWLRADGGAHARAERPGCGSYGGSRGTWADGGAHARAERPQAPKDEPGETLRRFYDSASVMMGTVELTEDDIVHVSDNQATATAFGTTPEAMRGRTARALGVPEQYVSMWLDAYRASVTSPGPVRFEYEHEGMGWLKVTVNYVGLGGGRQRFLYVVDDVSDLKGSEQALREANERLEARVHERTAELSAANDRLERDAYYDALTGLPNRLLFTHRLDHALEHHRRDPGSGFAVLFMDLDRFKVVNDSLGHAAGDALLRAVGERLLGCLREADTLARFGGDEFAVLLQGSDAGRAAEVVDRLQGALARPFELGGRSFTLSASVGVVLPEAGHRGAHELLRDADLAMYRAKAHRPGRHAFFDHAMRREAVRRLELEADLRRELERGELAVYYQPVVRLHDGVLSGFEALVRWPHPRHGLLAPDAFIPLAEETGLIIKLDRFVLNEACRQLGRWRRLYPALADLSVSVNLSSKQFLHPGLTGAVERAVLEHGLEPRHLNVELTESLLLQPAASVDAVVGALAALGVGLHLDDFGTGYASLASLRRFPAGTLKIDRSFVRDVSRGGRDAALVEGIVALARRLGLRVVAEGVETETQLERLKDMRCEYAQGYLFAEPLTTEQAEVLLADTLQIGSPGRD